MGLHSPECLPTPSFSQYRRVRDAIKARVLADPTIKPSVVYREEVDRVRDLLTGTDLVEFDHVMPVIIIILIVNVL